MKWDEWRGSLDGKPTFYIKKLFEVFNIRVSIHKFVGPDDWACFHTHPATAIRIVLWGGYDEEILTDYGTFQSRRTRRCSVGTVGIVKPKLCHRISKLLNGKSSYSLWIRFKKVATIELRGCGWEKQKTMERERYGKSDRLIR